MGCTVEIKRLDTISVSKLEMLAGMSRQEQRTLEENVKLGIPNRAFLTFKTGEVFF